MVAPIVDKSIKVPIEELKTGDDGKIWYFTRSFLQNMSLDLIFRYEKGNWKIEVPIGQERSKDQEHFAFGHGVKLFGFNLFVFFGIFQISS